MGRSPCCDDQSDLKKGPWTTEEDQKLVDYINQHGHGSWRALPKLAGLNRCGKSCRLRWTNYLRPDIKRGKFSEDEERVIINLHAVVGNKWSKIATHLPGRTDNEIKNYWNTHLRKKLLQMGLDPTTHKPRTDLNQLLNLSQLLSVATVGNMMSSTTTPWDNALRLQASAAQLAKMQLLQNFYMQVINSSSMAAPDVDMKNNCTGVFGNSQNVNLFGGNSNRENTTILLRDQEWNLDCISGEPNELNNIISNSLEGYEVRLNSNMYNNSNSCYDMQSNKNKVPELVSASSPGSSITDNKMESTTSTGDIPAAAGQSSATSIFEAWEKLMDDDTSDSYWKDILQSMS